MNFKLIVILTSMLVFSGSSYAQTDQIQLSASQLVVENQIKAFHQRQHEEAFQYAAPALRIVFRDVENFIRMVKRGYNPIYAAQSWAFGRSRSEGEKIHHEVLISGPNGGEWTALYSLQKQEDGMWKIVSVQLLKSTGKST
jgi:hypothetical protein